MSAVEENTGDSSSQTGFGNKVLPPIPTRGFRSMSRRYIPRAILHKVGVASLAQLTHHTPGASNGRT